MINKDFEFSKPLGFGNQQEEKENKEKENMEKGEKALDYFIHKKIVKESRGQHPNFPLETFGFISTWVIRDRIKRGYFPEKEREDIKKQLQKVSETGHKITKEHGRSIKLLMAIIHKIIGDEFFIFRPAEYDKFFNKADLIIAESTGEEPICVLDITTFQKKGSKEQRRVVDDKMKIAYITNLSGGAKLNFFGLKDRKKSNIPFFALP